MIEALSRLWGLHPLVLWLGLRRAGLCPARRDMC
jgi:hypothetical protein